MALSWRENAVFRWGLAGLCAAAGVMLAAWAVSQFGSLSLLYPITNPVTSLQYGNPCGLYTILCAVAGVLSTAWVAGEFVRGMLERRRREQALCMNHRLIQESYQAAEEKLRQNAAMRHERKNQVAARAETLGVDFHAAAPVPPELSIDTGNLCSLLLNMLDNALEAASQIPVPGKREVACAIKVRQGHLAVRCENTYAGFLSVDERGKLQTTKTDGDGHGFGLAQMKAIAEKHGSVLNIRYAEGRFIAQTALKIQ